MQEGDLVGALQKTLDLIGQLRGAAQQGPLGAGLVPLLDEADALLRRGVVERQLSRGRSAACPTVGRGRGRRLGIARRCRGRGGAGLADRAQRATRRPASARRRRSLARGVARNT